MPIPIGIPVQNGVPISLLPGVKYELKNGGNNVSQTGLVDLTPSERGRKIGLTFGSMPISASGKIVIDGDFYSSIQGDPKNQSPYLILLPGVLGYDVPYLALSGAYLDSFNPGGTKYNPVRVLEMLGGIGNGSGGSSVALDASVAAAGTGSGTLVSGQYMSTGQLLYIQWGISQDTLGTSPHASYIQINDPQDAVIAKVRGAVNPYGTLVIRVNVNVSSSTPYTFSYENGDSVAHWFLLVATVI